jgi:peptide/nickel transport system permease protein
MSNIYLWSLPYDPIKLATFPKDLPPSFEHPLGTTTRGRSVLNEGSIALNNSIILAFTAASIGVLIGAFVGFISGFYGGYIDLALNFITDIFLVIPLFLIIILIGAFITNMEIWMMGLLIAIFSWGGCAKAVRSQSLSLKERKFVLLSQLSGESKRGIIVKDLMPYMIQYLGSEFFTTISWAISLEAALGILGLGSQHLITIGTMLNRAMVSGAIFRGVWWWWATPIMLIIWLITSIYLIHIGLDSIVDPRLREGKLLA